MFFSSKLTYYMQVMWGTGHQISDRLCWWHDDTLHYTSLLL